MLRRWLHRALWLAGFGCLWIHAYDDPPLRGSAQVLAVATDSVTLGLITATPVLVRAQVWDEAGERIAVVDDPSPRRRHALVVPGLRPDGRYRYELAVDGGETFTGRCRAAPADDRAAVHFAFLGDSGDQPWWVWLQRSSLWHWPARWGWLPAASAVKRIGADVAAASPDFVLHLGDVVYPKGLHAHYRSGFFVPFAEALANAPFLAVLGNHDVLDTGGLQFLANLREPGGGDARAGGGRCTSFAWGPVRVIGLDANSDYTGERFAPGHPAHAYLERQLAECSEPWIVVASHFPMHSASRQFDRGELLLSLLPVLREQQVDLYLAGHDHCYQRFGRPGEDRPVQVVSGGGGKDLYEVRPHQRAAVLVSAHHWGSARVVGTELRIRCHGLDGAVHDDFGLELPVGDRLARIAARNPARADRIRRLRG